MILSNNEVMCHPEFSNLDEVYVKNKLDSIELMVRKYTNNNFQNRHIRFTSDSIGHELNGSPTYLKVGDTIQISNSKVNDGLYVITDIDENHIYVDKPLFYADYNLVTKIEYPIDVKEGVLNLLRWEINHRNKVGIKSESLSRHSVTYFDLDSSNQVMGYPVSLLGFLEPYMKARF